MSEVKTYDLEDTGSAYQQYREMVEQTEYEGDWVRIEDYRQLEKENAELKSKVERLENCIITMHHEEYSNSPDEIKKYIKEIYTGQHDQYFEATIKECLKIWGEGE